MVHLKEKFVSIVGRIQRRSDYMEDQRAKNIVVADAHKKILNCFLYVIVSRHCA